MLQLVRQRSFGQVARWRGTRISLALPSSKWRRYSTPNQNTTSQEDRPVNPTFKYDPEAYKFRGSGYDPEAFESETLQFGEAPEEGEFDMEEDEVEKSATRDDGGTLFKIYSVLPKPTLKKRRVVKKDLKPPPIATLPRKRLPYSDVRNYPKEVFPFEEDPSPPEQYMDPAFVPTNWIHAKNNDGQGTVVYQLQYNNWRIKNAFDLESLTEFHNHMKKLDNGSFPYAIVVRGSERTGVFSPGADLHSLRSKRYAADFYRTTAETCYTIATMQTPTFMTVQGDTAGVGAGLCLHSMFRLATDECSWAMPNVRFGSIPDAGATWMLPRLKGSIGMYLALTGKRLESYDVVRAGIATHFISLGDLDWWEQATSLVKDKFIFQDMLKHFLMQTSVPKVKSALKQNEEAIQRCFSQNTLEGVFNALEAENTPWAVGILKGLRNSSPLMLHVTFRLQKMGLMFQSLEEALQMEYRVALNMLAHPDFKVGRRRALTRRKDRWMHRDIYSVPAEDVAYFFKPHPREALNFVPAQPGLRPQDPYRIYDSQMKVLIEDPGYLIAKELDKLLPPQDQDGKSLKDLYVVLMEAGELNREAAEFFYKLETLQTLPTPDITTFESDTGMKKKITIDLDDPDHGAEPPELLFGAFSYKIK